MPALGKPVVPDPAIAAIIGLVNDAMSAAGEKGHGAFTAEQIERAADGNQALADNVNKIADQIPPEFAQVATDLSKAAPQVNDALTRAAAALQTAADDCTGTPAQCDALRQAAADATSSACCVGSPPVLPCSATTFPAASATRAP